jgi:alkylation response protein AidB-like acyl-CoA dehydrogenase
MPMLSEDQVVMIDTLRRVCATGEGYLRTRTHAAEFPDFDRTTWLRLREDGWPLLLVATEAGGIGANALDLVALCDGTGGDLAPEPLASVAVAVNLLARCGTADSAALLEHVAAGSLLPLVAQRASFQLAGDPTHVLGDAGWADLVLWGDAQKPSRVFSAPIDSIAGDLRRTTDGGALLFFHPPSEAARPIASGPDGARAYLDAQDLLRLAAASTLVAVARTAIDRTLSHLRTRQQFGVAIGSFQALQHQMATCHVATEATRALCFEAARAFGAPHQTKASLMAKAEAARAAMNTLKACVQYHGAMGFCDETDVALLFRRAHSLHAALGTPTQCLHALGCEWV